MACNGSQPNFTISFTVWILNWKRYSLPYLDWYCELLDSAFLPQHLYILHFHAVSSSPARSVHERKLQNLAILLPNSKTFRAVSGIFSSSQYHGMADSRCFVFVSWNLRFSVSVRLKESFCLISFSSGSVSGTLLWQWHIAIQDWLHV